MSSDDATSLLIIIVDTNPVWWGLSQGKGDGQLTLSQCLDNVLVCANSHLMMNHKNKLAVIASHTNASHFLYPRPDLDQRTTEGTETANGQTVPGDGRHELFSIVNESIRKQIKELVLSGLCGELFSDSLLAGSMAMALCYIHRLEKECVAGEEMSARILIVKGSEDNPAQYMNFMNVVFTAQKQNVVIDACILDNDSGLLQQACDITGGIYLKIPQMTGLLQYLLWVFLPDKSTRDKLTLPPKAQVDYRAACFCHRTLIDVGYVCSVCLSIFCHFSPICSTCQTTFRFLGPPKSLKKKGKRSAVS
ncbi:general transcription factor IIH subunit 3-like isoform X2 [Liolophura sinensis]|uniref:general transcription factor IIH subunit 3-like isoform X2 n=1 Tax=Liolophura sinensis TaxID=3198878 RepID=UPI0031594E7C